jgi:hypothetical protein
VKIGHEKKFKKNEKNPCTPADLWYLKNMNNTTAVNPNEIPASTTLVKFTYAKPLKGGGVSVTQRIVRMGREVILPLLAGGSTWGKSNNGNRFVALLKKDTDQRREYLQGVEEQENGRLQIKRFDFSYVSDLQVLA